MIRTVLFVLLLVCAAGNVQAVWPFGSSDKEKRKELRVIGVLQEPTRVMNEAQDAESNGKTEEAVVLYKRALKMLVDLEHSENTTGSEFAPLRFKKAMCETMIDRLLFDKAEKFERAITVTDTQNLAAQLERERAVLASNQVAQAKAREAAAVSNELARVESLKKAAAEKAKVEAEKAAAAEKARIEGEKNRTEAERAVATAKLKAEQEAARVEAEKAEAARKAKVEQAVAAAKNGVRALAFAKDMLEDQNYDQTEKSLFEVLKVFPDHVEALELLGFLRLRQKRYEDALIAVESVLDRFPKDDTAALIGASAAAGVRNFPRAMELLEGVLSRRPNDPVAYNNMAWVLVEMRNPKNLAAAEGYYRRGVELGGRRDAALEKKFGIGE